MNDQYYASRKGHSAHNSGENTVKPNVSGSNQSGYNSNNTTSNRQASLPLSTNSAAMSSQHQQQSNQQHPSMQQNMMPQLVNLIPSQISNSQSASAGHHQPLINMNFSAHGQFLPNPQLYQLSNTYNPMNNAVSQPYNNANNLNYMSGNAGNGQMRMNSSNQSSSGMMNFKDTPRHHMIQYHESNHNSHNVPRNKHKNFQNDNSNSSAGIYHLSQNKLSSYPVRLLVNVELVGPLIGRKGEKIKEITVNTGAKIDIKRESVPYSQFGLNQYMFSGCSNTGRPGGDATEQQIVMGRNGTSSGASRLGESQIVFVTGEPDRCSAAVEEIMHLCSQEAAEQGRREEPALGLLVEDRFCARLIGKDGRHLNVVRARAGCQVHVSNVPTITTLQSHTGSSGAHPATTSGNAGPGPGSNGAGGSPHVISLDRIISCRAAGSTSTGNNSTNGLPGLLQAERMISEKVRQCVAEDAAAAVAMATAAANGHGGRPRHGRQHSVPESGPAMYRRGPPLQTAAIQAQVYPPQPPAPSQPTQQQIVPLQQQQHQLPTPLQSASAAAAIGSGIVHRANPNWPDSLKLDENLYVRIPQACAGSIIGSEGKAVRRIMAETGTYIQISKSNLSRIESVPAVHTYRKQTMPTGDISSGLSQRLVTVKGGAVNQCNALAHIFHRVRLCYSQQQQQQHQTGCGLSDNSPDTEVPEPVVQDVRLWVLLRVPKMMLGRLIGKDGKVIRQLQHNSRTFLSFPRMYKVDEDNGAEVDSGEHKSEEGAVEPDPSSDGGNALPSSQSELSTDESVANSTVKEAQGSRDTSSTNTTANPDLGSPTATPATIGVTAAGSPNNPDATIFADSDLHPVEIYGSHESVEEAIYLIRRLVYTSIFTQFGPALIPGPASFHTPGAAPASLPPGAPGGPPTGVQASSYFLPPPPGSLYMHHQFHAGGPNPAGLPVPPPVPPPPPPPPQNFPPSYFAAVAAGHPGSHNSRHNAVAAAGWPRSYRKQNNHYHKTRVDKRSQSDTRADDKVKHEKSRSVTNQSGKKKSNKTGGGNSSKLSMDSKSMSSIAVLKDGTEAGKSDELEHEVRQLSASSSSSHKESDNTSNSGGIHSSGHNEKPGTEEAALNDTLLCDVDKMCSIASSSAYFTTDDTQTVHSDDPSNTTFHSVLNDSSNGSMFLQQSQSPNASGHHHHNQEPLSSSSSPTPPSTSRSSVSPNSSKHSHSILSSKPEPTTPVVVTSPVTSAEAPELSVQLSPSKDGNSSFAPLFTSSPKMGFHNIQEPH